LLLLPDTGKVEHTTTIVDKVLQAFRQPFVLNDYSLYLTTSIGIAIFPDDGTDADPLVKNADTAMYRAKDEGRDNFQLYAHD
jgi:diguanylate cyclase (GGDEF)-like protein